MKDIIETQYCDEMQKAYLDYSMSVITDRAIADIRDALKPVQRRIIYAMYKLGLKSTSQHRKSARIVGDTMGKYHPHGDSSIYESLVVMQQDFKKKVPLIDGHGNFGSLEGDTPAAMRYTEARLQEFTTDVYLQDIDMNTVDFVQNFDSTELEPSVLAAKLPMILINGCEGIAVGMATSIPPHNLDEIVECEKLLIKKPQTKEEELLEIIQGPDFALKCEIINKSDFKEIYKTGQGKLNIRGMMHFEKKASKDLIVITALPPGQLGLGLGRFLDDLVALNDKKLTSDISDIRNETDETGLRVVVELRKDADKEFVKKLIENKTRYTDTFAVSMLVIEDGRAKILGVRDIILSHIKFLKEITKRKYTFLFEKYTDKEEVLDGLIKAVDIIDLIIEIIRGSRSIEIAKNCLMNGITDGINFKSQKSKKQAEKLIFTQKQAQAILEMRLSKLIGLEILALNDEYEEVVKKINECEKIINSEKYLNEKLINDLQYLKKKYHQERITKLSDVEKEKIVIEKKEEFYSVEIDDNSYIMAQKSNDNKGINVGSFDRIIIFTSQGQQLQIKVDDIPLKKNNPKGTPLENLCNFNRTIENIVNITKRSELNGEILFITQSAMAKIVSAEELITNVSKSKATKLKPNDTLVAVKSITEYDIIILKLTNGSFYKARYEDVSKYKKNTQGSKLITLPKNAKVEKVFIVNKNETGIEIDDNKLMLKRFEFLKQYKPR